MKRISIIYIALLFSLFTSYYCQQQSSQNTITVEALTSYNKWRNSNKRVYLNDDEQSFRQIIFFENLKNIREHNKNPVNTYQIALNQFSDMTQQEFLYRILNPIVADNPQTTNTTNTTTSSEQNSVPQIITQAANLSSIDWRLQGAISSIKNQGSCGSCWAFSTAALMESYNFLKNGVTTDFSEQQLVDCVTSSLGYYSYGCKGGNPYYALSYSIKYGILKENQYPYVAVQGNCKVSSPTTGYYPKTLKKIANTVTDLQNALNLSPVAVVVDASNMGSYSSGIFNGCSATVSLNHAVLAVGYDASGNWIIKNSWGTYWGESGYMRLAAGNQCGIISYNFSITS